MDDRASEILIDSSEKTVGTNAVTLGNIPNAVCYGRVFLVKRTTGDTIYIAFGSKEPSAQSYHVILTDDFPIFDDNVVIGDIKAVSTAATAKLSIYARGGFWKDR